MLALAVSRPTFSAGAHRYVPQEIKAKTQALQQAVMKIGESLAGSSSSSSSENVQDAEVKDKDKESK